MAIRKGWVYDPPKPAIPAPLKAKVTRLAEELIAERKPLLIVPPPPYWTFNTLVDLHGRWRGRFYYFIATYGNPNNGADAPTLECGVARLTYIGNERFDLVYRDVSGPTERWRPLYDNLPLDMALATVREEVLEAG